MSRTAGESAGSHSDAPATLFMQGVSGQLFEGLNDVQKGFVTSIRLLEGSEEDTSSLPRSVADMFPPADLFCKELRSLPSVYSELRNFLDSRGARMTQHSSRRIMMTLAHNLYEEQVDKQAAVDIVQLFIASGRRNRDQSSETQIAPAPVSPSSQSPGASSIDKIAHNVAMRLKDKDRKFSGAIGECWMEFVDEYKQISRDYGLSMTQKWQYMQNLLRGDAKRFYFDKVDGYATGFNQTVDIVEKEYNSTVRQTRGEALSQHLENFEVHC